ncbi:MAG: response regulator transcription factor [Saprospiraceae bacterium]|nr:response regulator transcription factor [Saprospiraceae bacterium]
MLKILIIEDERKLGLSIRDGLLEQGFECDLYFDGNAALDAALEEKYSVIVSDVMLPGLSGFELIKKIRGEGIHTPFIFLTALAQMEDKSTGFESGADDYLVKPFEFKELLMRIKALARRPIDTSITSVKNFKYFDLEVNYRTNSVYRSLNGNRIQLTPKEFALLDYFIRNPERIISKEELCEKVWELDFDTGTNIVEVYINFLRKKIDKDHSVKLIHTVYKTGYIFKAE